MINELLTSVSIRISQKKERNQGNFARPGLREAILLHAQIKVNDEQRNVETKEYSLILSEAPS